MVKIQCPAYSSKSPFKLLPRKNGGSLSLSLSVSFLTSIVFMSSSFVQQKTNLTKPTSNFNFCSLGKLPSFQWFPYGLPTMAGLPYGFPMPDAATKPSRPYRLGISQMQSDLATNLGPRFVWLKFWRVTKTQNGILGQMVTIFCDTSPFLFLFCDKNHNIIHLFVDADVFVVLKFGNFPKPFCLGFFENVSLSSVFPAFNTMILSIDLWTH